jgi:hypothetical protein
LAVFKQQEEKWDIQCCSLAMQACKMVIQLYKLPCELAFYSKSFWPLFDRISGSTRKIQNHVVA